jgi:hypothetical protein
MFMIDAEIFIVLIINHKHSINIVYLDITVRYTQNYKISDVRCNRSNMMNIIINLTNLQSLITISWKGVFFSLTNSISCFFKI